MNEQLQRAKDAALAGFRDSGPGHLNCAQTVLHFAAQVIGAPEDSVILARYFGGGITGMGHVCGALSGCALSLGLRDRHFELSWPDRSSPDAERLQELLRQFEVEFGTRTCIDLIGYELSTEESHDRYEAEGKHVSCEKYVSWACDHLYELLTPRD